MTVYEFLAQLTQCFDEPQKEDFKTWIKKHLTNKEKYDIISTETKKEVKTK